MYPGFRLPCEMEVVLRQIRGFFFEYRFGEKMFGVYRGWGVFSGIFRGESNVYFLLLLFYYLVLVC